MDPIEYQKARHRLNLIQEVWGRYGWMQIGGSLERYGLGLRHEVASVFEEPAEAARMLPRYIHSTNQGIEKVVRDETLRIKVSKSAAVKRIQEGFDGGSDGEVMRATMRLLDASRPPLGTARAIGPGHVGIALLRYWEMTSGRALSEYQRGRGDALPASEDEWVMRQKVALHRAEQIVDIMEGHTSGYLDTPQKLAEARRTLGRPNPRRYGSGCRFGELPESSGLNFWEPRSRDLVKLDSSRWREKPVVPTGWRTKLI